MTESGPASTRCLDTAPSMSATSSVKFRCGLWESLAWTEKVLRATQMKEYQIDAVVLLLVSDGDAVLAAAEAGDGSGQRRPVVHQRHCPSQVVVKPGS